MAKAQALAALLLAVVALTTMKGANAICAMANEDFKLCQPAAAVNDPTDSPSEECCAALGKADLGCICRYQGVAGIWMRIYHIDPSRAMALPGKCGLTMPSNCS
uniref:Bifunctional inhibitor/plant lipid transfer protein/seed storage helical domain-containing protein n=1 Tax=Arundo donax TaxID=35708 RepID=A0A0A9FLF9_ARUDO